MVNSFNTFIYSQTKKQFVKMLEIPYINFLCSKRVRYFFLACCEHGDFYLKKLQLSTFMTMQLAGFL